MGVGATRLARMIAMGAHVDQTDPIAEARARGAQLSGSSCWKNSPQARAAVAAAIEAARQYAEPTGTQP